MKSDGCRAVSIVEESLHMLGSLTYNLAENVTVIPAKQTWNKT